MIIRNQPGAVGFMPRLVNYNPFGLIQVGDNRQPSLPGTMVSNDLVGKVDKETGEVVRGSNGLCVACRPGEEGEMVGLVRQSDRGGPNKFKAYVDKEDPNKGREWPV